MIWPRFALQDPWNGREQLGLINTRKAGIALAPWWSKSKCRRLTGSK